ncbi:MAG TPA: phosphatidate cytidylyltransferase, partial [Isosphaeraceae bacterium]|nr:phosphatidate cytidylyltransferase [Isosphaeraceae bacterium]
MRDHGRAAPGLGRSVPDGEDTMNQNTWDRLFGYRHAFDEPVVVLIVSVLGLALALSPLAIFILDRAGRLGPALKKDLWQRYVSWLIMVPIVVLPVLLGAAWTILAVAVLSLFCYREFARATGLFREKVISLLVVVGILALTFAVADHWYRLFTAMTPMSIVVIAAVATSLDRPKGYIQRVALAIFGLVLFGTCLGHLGFMTNDTHYRSLILLLIFCVQLNDVFAYMVGKSLGGPKLVPQTSPNKTISGSLGAIVLTTLLVYWLSGIVFPAGPLGEPLQRLVLGLIISIGGQMGDLTVSAIKRDVGIKDMGSLIPGHGGVLDRANSLLLAAPAMFHFVNHFREIGLDQAANLISGGG